MSKKRVKTSKAVVLSMRINPIHPEHARVLEIVQAQAARGKSFAEVVISSILRYGHIDPVHFERDRGLRNDAVLIDEFAQVVQDVLTQEIQGLLQQLQQVAHSPSGSAAATHIDTETQVSEWARNFGARFSQRAKRKDGS